MADEHGPDVSRFGNFGLYIPHPHFTLFEGLVECPEAILKMYAMSDDGHAMDRDLVGESMSYIQKLLSPNTPGALNPFSGLGFAILSHEYLNVARWDLEDPVLLHNQPYSFGKERPCVFSPLENMDDGAFCAWELGVADVEKRAWLNYLRSRGTKKDKRVYLSTYEQGWLSSPTE